MSYVSTTEQRIDARVKRPERGFFGLPCPACGIQVFAFALTNHLTGDRHKFSPTMATVLRARALNLYDIAIREADEVCKVKP